MIQYSSSKLVDRIVQLLKAWYSPFRLGLLLGGVAILLTWINNELQGYGLFAYQYIPPGDLIAAANKLSAFSFLVIYVSFSLVFLLLQTVLFWPLLKPFCSNLHFGP